jgi:hypothetical protein
MSFTAVLGGVGSVPACEKDAASNTTGTMNLQKRRFTPHLVEMGPEMIAKLFLA